jgi:hypothetical protein
MTLFTAIFERAVAVGLVVSSDRLSLPFTLTLSAPDGLSLEPVPLPAALPLFGTGLGP